MVVSTPQSIRCLCEHRDEDVPTHAWQGMEDRHVTMLLPLISDNGFSKLLAKPVELPTGIGKLVIDEPQLLDQHSDVRGRSLYRPLSYAQGRLAQFTDHMGRVETAYAMALQNARNGLF